METRSLQGWDVDDQCVVLMASRTADGLYLGICRADGVLVQDITGSEDDALREAEMTRQVLEACQLDTATWNPQLELVSYDDLNDAAQDLRVFAVATPDEVCVEENRVILPTQAQMAIAAGAETIRLSRHPAAGSDLWDADEGDADSAIDYVYRRDRFDRRIDAAYGEARVLEDYADEMIAAVVAHMQTCYADATIDRDYIRRECERICNLSEANND